MIMNVLTHEELAEKLIEHNYEAVNDEGDPIESTCPNELIKERGKPDVVRLYYNNRWYYWELVE